MEVFLVQLWLFFGIVQFQLFLKCLFLGFMSEGLMIWELDWLFWVWLVENLVIVIIIFIFLVQFLGKISNIVIKDDVVFEVYKVVVVVQKLVEELVFGYLVFVFVVSQEVVIFFEFVFFDLLFFYFFYFFDDQKFVIYILFFLFMVVFIFLFLVKIFLEICKFWRKFEKID